MISKKGNEKFTTLDAYLSSFLVLKGIAPELIANNGKIVFSFPLTNKLDDAIRNYNSGAMVQAAQFAMTVKNLKARIFSMK